MLRDSIEKAAFEALRLATIKIPPDVKNALEKLYREEESEACRSQLKAILEDIKVAEELGKPICQDTGLVIFYVEVGTDFPAIEEIEEAFVSATRRATKEIPLRPNTVHPFTHKNPGDNTGRFVPYIHWKLVPGNELKFTVVPKGGGSENTCALYFPPPGEGLRAVKKAVIEAVYAAGAKPCPPNIIGVGIGGGADISMKLAKEAAVLRKVGERHPDPKVASLEEELCSLLNELGIGAMGLGGKFTVLDVHVEFAHRHPASLPVAVAFQCWAARRATAIVKPDGSYEIGQ